MLQIATGRLFVRDPGRTNHLRGTVYTNAAFMYETTEVQVAIGRLLPPSTTRPGVKAIAYEFVERIELQPDGTQGILVSSTEAPYTLDFATVCSFALNCVCSPDYALVQRLIGMQRGVSTGLPPGRFVKRMFDTDFLVQPSEVAFLQAFLEQLIGLPRVKFLGAMRAIRTYVTAMHRLADDLELAYTLLVASVESLAQEFDEHQADWASLEDRKRNAIDGALAGAPDNVAQRVRTAMLTIEHVALARRFREFTLAHTSTSFFRGDAVGVDYPSARPDLEDCLREAYTLRSKYVHSLKALPHILTTGNISGEVVLDGNSSCLTLAGLARLMRHVIVNFVMQQEAVAHEVYDYQLERHGVGLYRLTPAYWVGNADGDIRGVGRDKLAGFLEQLSGALLRTPGAVVTDLRPVLTQANDFIPTITRELRRPYLTLMALFNWYAPLESRVTPSPAVSDLITKELGVPSTEALFAYCLVDQLPTWQLNDHLDALSGYFRRRSRKGLRAPRLLEAAITLDLAERFRGAGERAESKRLVALAVEVDPGNKRLTELEANLNDAEPIRWRTVLLVPPSDAATAAKMAPEVSAASIAEAEGTSLSPSANGDASGVTGKLAIALRKLASRIEQW